MRSFRLSKSAKRAMQRWRHVVLHEANHRRPRELCERIVAANLVQVVIKEQPISRGIQPRQVVRVPAVHVHKQLDAGTFFPIGELPNVL